MSGAPVNERPRRILLLDADQFYVQVARLVDPDGAGKEELLLVGGTPDQRGVVASASYATRAYGVRSAMPMARALRLCPEASVVPIPRAACTDKSREIRRVLERFTPVVEAASIDEAYLDLTGTERLYGGRPLAEVAAEIQTAVRDETEIAVSIGGGTSKIVAKLASGLAKPAGVHVVEPGDEIAFMRRLELADIPGVGPVMARRLERHGLTSVAAALDLDEPALRRMLGPRRGAWLWRRVRGIDGAPVDADRDQKSISREETFPRDLEHDDDLERELLALSTRAAADLRAQGLHARTVTVKLRDGDFRTRQASRTLPEPVDSDRAVYTTARQLLARLRSDRRTSARLLGVALAGLDPDAHGAQLELFGQGRSGPVESDRDRALSEATDRLRSRFGPGALRPGRLLEE